MSWLYSRALVEAFGAGSYLDGAPSALLSTSHTPQAFLPSDKMTAFSRLSRFGMTFKPLTENRGEDLLTLYLADFHARTSVPQVKVQGSMENALGFGQKWHELSVKYDLATCSWKTHQCLWDEVLPESSVTLPRWGMMRDGVLYQRAMLVRPISVTEFGYSQLTSLSSVPTPTKSDGERGATKNYQPIRASGHKASYTLVQYVHDNPRAHAQFPTPTVCRNNNRKGLSKTSGDGLATYVRKYPIPKAQDSRHALTDRGKCNLGEVIAGESNGGRLNPTWVEWLMGFPLEWTDLKPLAMHRFHSWQQSLGGF